MADNVVLSAAVGTGDTVAADEIASAKYQRVKITLGADGVNDGDVSSANAMPISHAALTELAAAIDTEVQVDVVSSALPSGAATAAKQPALGTAGTASADVISVQGIASMTPLQVGDNSGSLTVDAPVATPVFVRLSDGAAAISTLPVSLASVPSHAVTNAGTFATQVDGAALTALQLIDDPVIADDAAFIPATSKVMMAGFQADETSTDSVDEGDAGAARMTLDRKQITNPQPHTAGGYSVFRSLDIDETEEEVKASAGQVYGWYIFNAVASIRYVKFYNATAANVTVGTTTPVLTLPVPTSSTNGVGFAFNTAMGIAFDTAISVACTTGLADNDVGAPGTNDVVIQVFYK